MLRLRSLGVNYDDVLIVPDKCLVGSRNEISLSCPRVSDRSPVIPANMFNIAGVEMGKFCIKNKFPFILNRYATLEEIKELLELNNPPTFSTFAISIGLLTTAEMKRLKEIIAIANYPLSFCVDIAYGYTDKMADTIKRLRDLDGVHHVIAGNICTPEGVWFLETAGANIIKVGVGNGSVCTTRMATGAGYPQLQAIIECARTADSALIIADGGIKTPGDAAKALGAGADYVMIGSEFAGTDKTPGYTDSGLSEYNGMASERVKMFLTQGTPVSYIEGESIKVAPKGIGSTEQVFKTYEEGLRSSISYAGFSSLSDFRGNAEFILTNKIK